MFKCSKFKNVKTSKGIRSGWSFVSPYKSYKQVKYVLKMDDFDNIVRIIVHKFCDKGDYPNIQLVFNSVKKKKLFRMSWISAKIS